jgi:hypothetical protein
MKQFHDARDRVFRFLGEEFGCRITERRDTHNVDWVRYENGTTAMEVVRDPHQPGIIVSFHVLGTPPASAVASPLPRHFYLDNLLELYDGRPLIGDPWASDFDLALAPFAAAVRQYATEILRGDFRQLPKIQKIIERHQ